MIRTRRPRTGLAIAVGIAVVSTACSSQREADDAAAGDTGQETAAATEEPSGSDSTATTSETEQAAACPEPSTGITDDVMRLGGSYPLSGPASAYGAIADGLQIFLGYANDELGGAPGVFEGRQFEYFLKDDGYSPPAAVESVRELVEQDEVFALLQTLGTPPTLATWDYANEQEVPQLFVATGATAFGLDEEGHPWTIAWQPNYVSEARIYAQYLLENDPDATVAVLYQNDDYGLDYLEGFRDAIEGSDIEIVAEQSYETTDPTVDSQMTNLEQSGADVFFNITTPSFAAQAMGFDAQSDWDPIHLLNSVSNSLTTVGAVGFDNLQGMVTALYIKDAQDPQWQDSDDMQLYLETVPEYDANADVNNGYVAYGWALGSAFYNLLETVECPTRESLMEAARSMDGIGADLLLPGITMETGPDDNFPLEAMQVATLDGETWSLQGEVIDTREVFGPVSAATSGG